MKIKSLNMIPMQFNSDIINKPKYNILKKKLTYKLYYIHLLN